MKNYIIFLMLSFTALIFCGCSSLTGNKLETTVAPDFQPQKFKYFKMIYADDKSIGFPDVDMVLYELKLNRYQSDNQTDSTINVYLSSSDGLCLPPFLNIHVTCFMIFYEPKEVTIEMKDAATDKVLFRCYYWRGIFSSGADPSYIRNVIKKSICDAWKNSDTNNVVSAVT